MDTAGESVSTRMAVNTKRLSHYDAKQFYRPKSGSAIPGLERATKSLVL